MADKIIPVRVPRDNVNDETVKLVNWAAKDGQKLAAGDLAAEIETSKSVMEVRAPEAGHLRHYCKVGAEVPVGEILFFLTPGANDPLPEKEKAAVAAATKFSQKAQALMEQHGLDPARFPGKGLVRESDVLALLEKGKAETVGVPVHSEPLPRRKTTEIKYLSSGQNDLKSSVSVLCATKGLRQAAKLRADWGGSLTPVIVFEAARLLAKHKVFNAFYEDGTAHFYKEINVGFAVDTGEGLKVPVVRGADKKAASDIAREMQDLMLQYVGGELDVRSLSDGTFTVTDLSSEGVFRVSPLVNYKQSAILAVGAEFSGTYELTLAFDHRLSEGRAAAAFLRDLRDRLASYEAKA